MDVKLEVIVMPVADIDRAKEFYNKLGWGLDVTLPIVVQFTPPGSWCSVRFGRNLNDWYAESLMREQTGEELPQ